MKLFRTASLIAATVLLFQACKTTAPMVDIDEFVELDPIEIKSESELDIYRASNKRYFDLIHTKLEVKFDWDSSFMMGKAYLKLKPYFYDQNHLLLDAKGFKINAVALLDSLGKKSPLDYHYDSMKIDIKLPRTYSRKDTIDLFIDYVSMPNKLSSGGSEAISNDIGLYFINPLGENPKKPKQIWTQGETQASSCWFPTIDSPNERMTQEIYITVDSNYKTLSNGSLQFQIENSDGTRTDYWKQTVPDAPYLTMMAIGEYAVVRDEWEGKEVNYYVEPQYKDVARKIFPNTVEMISFFSEKLNYPYPWDKFDQVVVRDYVSGAMENTGAVIYGEFMQGDARFLIDNAEEDIVAHELFHHWFGDLVTCESWSNLPLNESFATYGEYLWNEHKYGADAAEYHLYLDLKAYLQESRINKKELIRYHYLTREDMFDAHSYQKGGRVLHMLRKYLGDEAFFEGLSHYLKQNEYQSVEIHQLRLAFEKVSGEDLNWFFNQWFLQAGHPEISVSSEYDKNLKTLKLDLSQTQTGPNIPNPFILETNLELAFANGPKQIIPIRMEKKNQHYEIQLEEAPLFVKLDANNDQLAQIEQDISSEQAIALFHQGENFLDRTNAINLIKSKSDSVYLDLLEQAFQDPFWSIRQLAVENCEKLALLRSASTLSLLKGLALNDPNSQVRASAYEAMASEFEEQLSVDDFEAGLSDSSYLVVSSSLWGTYLIDNDLGIAAAKQFIAVENEDLRIAVSSLFAEDANPAYNDYFLKLLDDMHGFGRYNVAMSYGSFLLKQENKLIQESVPHIRDMALEEKNWWMRMAHINNIANLQEDAQKKQEMLRNNLKVEENPDKLKTIENELVETDLVLEKIQAALKTILESEKEENIQRIIKQLIN